MYIGQDNPREFKNVLYAAAWFVTFVFFILLIRIWYLQVFKGKDFRELAESNSIRLVRTIAPRGIIFDTNGKMLVENRPSFDISIIPDDVKDLGKVKQTIHAITGITPEDIDEKLKAAKKQPAFQPVKIKEDISWEEVAKTEIAKIDMPGVILEIEPKRRYIFGDLITHLIGYLSEIAEGQLKTLKKANYRAGDYIGKYGVESGFEEHLRGINGGRQIEVDALGREVELLRKINPIQGNNIYLTIDLDTQIAARVAMANKVGSVVAIDPNNGRVLAFVSLPSFDPNIFSKGVSRETWTELVANPFRTLENKPVQGQYPPASTFKLITAAAALEEGIIKPSTKIYAGETFRFGNRDFRDWKQGGHGIIDIHRAIVESSDTFFYQVGLKVGVDRLAYYAKGFGLGQKTGIQLTDEKPGLVPSSKWKKDVYKVQWYEGETISVSVGQGYMLTTPIQMANAYAAISNGGKLFQPQIVDRVEDLSGNISMSFKPKEIGRVPVSDKTLDILKKALYGVVHEDGGTGRGLRIEGIPIAGKTGTAQVVKLKENAKRLKPHQVAYEQRDHAWFVGFAPADDPNIVVAVMVEHGGFGSEAAAPVAKEVIKAYLKDRL